MEDEKKQGIEKIESTQSHVPPQNKQAESSQTEGKKETSVLKENKPEEHKIERTEAVLDQTKNENSESKQTELKQEKEQHKQEPTNKTGAKTKTPASIKLKPTKNAWWLHKGWDIGLAVIMALLSCFCVYRINEFSILSFNWIWKIALILAILNLIFILLMALRKMPNWTMWVRRVLMVLICTALTYGSLFVNQLQSSLEEITKPETATTVNVSLITKKDGGAKLLSDLSGKKIGIQNANDTANSSYVKEQLQKESDLKNITYVEELDYETLYKKLMKEEIDALIITDYYFKTLLKENYPTIEDDIFILKSYQKERENDISTSNKDIRYEPFTVYIAGVDEGDDPSIDARSDVNIVLMVNPLANHIEMVSIPRDAFVPNPALNSHNDKLTHLGLSGIKNSMEGIEAVFGFEIDYYVKLNFFSVIDIIDAVGLIEVDVPISFCEQDENRSFAQKDLICLKEGKQKVNGKQALAFARHRKSYTDVMRGKAQQEVIKGIINVLTSRSGIVNINQVLSIATKAVSTNMPMQQVTNFVSAQLDNLKPWTIHSIVLENGADAHLVTASMPGQLLYVMLLNRDDVQVAFDAYTAMVNQMQFSSFTFRLDSLDQNKAQMPENSSVLWAGSNVSDYVITPPSETPPTEEPTEPEAPVTPEQPEESTPQPPQEELPDQPESDDPEDTTPEKPTPDDSTTEKPDTDKPDASKPDTSKPDTSKPDNNKPSGSQENTAPDKNTGSSSDKKPDKK